MWVFRERENKVVGGCSLDLGKMFYLLFYGKTFYICGLCFTCVLCSFCFDVKYFPNIFFSFSSVCL